MPQRIQRSRAKGWRMPAGAIYVGRPGRYGNAFDWMVFGREGAVDFFERWLDDTLTPEERASCGVDILTREWADASRKRLLAIIPELRGHDLMCWCPLDQPCHADILLKLANRN